MLLKWIFLLWKTVTEEVRSEYVSNVVIEMCVTMFFKKKCWKVKVKHKERARLETEGIKSRELGYDYFYSSFCQPRYDTESLRFYMKTSCMLP